MLVCIGRERCQFIIGRNILEDCRILALGSIYGCSLGAGASRAALRGAEHPPPVSVTRETMDTRDGVPSFVCLSTEFSGGLLYKGREGGDPR